MWYIDTKRRKAVYEKAYKQDTEDPSKSHGIEVALSYKKGGPNPFGGGYEQGGYELKVNPITKHDRGDYAMKSFIGGVGGRKLVKQSDRYNAKTLERLAERINPETIAREFEELGGDPKNDEPFTQENVFKTILHNAYIEAVK